MERIRHSLIHADVTYMITQTTVNVVYPSSGGPGLIYFIWYVDIKLWSFTSMLVSQLVAD